MSARPLPSTTLCDNELTPQGAFVLGANGHAVLDLTMGLGSLLFGHRRQEIDDAVRVQLTHGWLHGAEDAVVEEWTSLIRNLVPCAEQVIPTVSATEANLLALRVARSVTRRGWIMRFAGHYHGCFDEALSAGTAEASLAQGLHPMASSRLLVLDERDSDTIDDYLQTGKVAAVLIEPGGGGGGVLPYEPDRLARLRRATAATETLLIFDESMTGFRYGPAGVQGETGVLPDLCTMSKVLTGGLPGAALVGRADLLERVVGHRYQQTSAPHTGPVPHTSTFAAHPIAAAAGSASLKLAAPGTLQHLADDNAAQLCMQINLAAEGVNSDWRAFSTRSILHFVVTEPGHSDLNKPSHASAAAMQRNSHRHRNLSRAWLSHGVVTHPIHAWVSTEHGPQALEVLTRAAHHVFHTADVLDRN